MEFEEKEAKIQRRVFASSHLYHFFSPLFYRCLKKCILRNKQLHCLFMFFAKKIIKQQGEFLNCSARPTRHSQNFHFTSMFSEIPSHSFTQHERQKPAL